MICEIHHSISNHNSLEVYVFGTLVVVVTQNQVSYVWDVLACIALSRYLKSLMSYKQRALCELLSLVENEIFYGFKSISCSLFISPFVLSIFLSRKTNDSRRFQKE